MSDAGTKSKRLTRLFLTLVVIWGMLFTARIVFSRMDYNRVLEGKRPRFAWKTGYYSDGGSEDFQGIGYEITSLHELHVKNGLIAGYNVGPILKYQCNWLFFPQTDRKDIRLVPEHDEKETGGLLKNP